MEACDLNRQKNAICVSRPNGTQTDRGLVRESGSEAGVLGAEAEQGGLRSKSKEQVTSDTSRAWTPETSPFPRRRNGRHASRDEARPSLTSFCENVSFAFLLPKTSREKASRRISNKEKNYRNQFRKREKK